MYSIDEYLELFRELEKWSFKKYNDADSIKGIENKHPNYGIRKSACYFRLVRNNLTHYPNGKGKKQLILLTDEFKAQFEAFYNYLIGSIKQISVPWDKIKKVEKSDMVMPTVKMMRDLSYTYVPVMNGKKVWGVFSESAIFKIVSDGYLSLIDGNVSLYKIEKYISVYTKDGVYDFISNKATIDEVCTMFSDAVQIGRRLDVIYVTTTGDENGDLVGMVTVWDIANIHV